MLVGVESDVSNQSRARRRARAKWVALVSGSLFMVTACSDDEAVVPNPISSGGAPAAGSGAAGGAAADGDTPAAGSTGSTPTGSAGRAGSPRAGRGATEPSTPGSGDNSGGDVVVDEDAGVIDEDDAGLETPPVGTTPVDAGPTAPESPVGLPEPDVAGPNEVTIVPNVGIGFESPRIDGDLPGSTACADVAEIFGEGSPAATSFGPVPETANLELFTLYRPATFAEGTAYPLLIWGNGICQQPESYGELLRHVASHGFIIVAPNSRYVDAVTNPLLRALDWALSENQAPTSSLFGKIDPERVGVFGHAQGAVAAASLTDDPRVNTIVELNGLAPANVVYKPALFITSDEDYDPGTARNAYNLSPAPAAFIQFHNIPGGGNYPGHFTLISQPERVVGSVTAWLRARLLEDPLSNEWFSGASCRLCSTPDQYEFVAKNLD